MKLREAIRHHIITLCSNLDYCVVLLEEFWHLPDDYQNAIRAERHAYMALFRQILQEGIETGEFRAIPADLASLLLFRMINGVYQWFSPDGPSIPEEIGGVCADLVLASLRPDTAATS